MKCDLVSIIVPVYNTKNYIERCVNSLLRQTYPNIEIIMVDDGSVDGSAELLDSLARTYPLRVIHKQNGGAGSARNVGLDIAAGEWIVFADSDDLYSETAIAYLVNICERNHCMLACCGVTVEESDLSHAEGDGKSETKVYNGEIGMQKLLEEQILSYLSSKIYHRSLFSENLRIPEGMTFEDLFIMPEIFAKVNRIAETTEKLYYYYQNREGNVSRSRSVKHSLDLSIAQRHRYDMAVQLPELPESTKALLLFKAVRSSLGAYRCSASEKAWKRERTGIVEFMKKYCQDIMCCRTLTIPYKCLAFVLSMAQGE